MEKHAMKPKILSGFEELDHIADLSLKVWASSIEELFMNAAKGFNHLVKPKIDPTEATIKKKLLFEGIDFEDLLISMLSEINYFLQVEHLSTDLCNIQFEPGKLSAEVSLNKTLGFKREVKAVTYHNLKIIQNNNTYSTVIVFDI